MAKKTLTKKQYTILTLLYVFRFLTSKQIQQFLQHKDHRRINSWLKDLTEKKYVEREFTPRFGALTKPALYHISPQGIMMIKDTYPTLPPSYLRRLRDDNNRSKAFRIKCQLIADCYMILFEDYVKEFPSVIEEWLAHGVTLKYNTFHFFTQAFYDELEFPLLAPLKPDMYAIFRTREEVTHTFINVIDAYVPRLMLRYSIQNIFRVVHEEYWEDDTIEGLHIYFLCPNNMVIIYLKKILPSFLERYSCSTPLTFHFATRNQLYKRQREHGKKTIWSTISSDDVF